jgi:hypothetical protein
MTTAEETAISEATGIDQLTPMRTDIELKETVLKTDGGLSTADLPAKESFEDSSEHGEAAMEHDTAASTTDIPAQQPLQVSFQYEARDREAFGSTPSQMKDETPLHTPDLSCSSVVAKYTLALPEVASEDNAKGLEDENSKDEESGDHLLGE